MHKKHRNIRKLLLILVVITVAIAATVIIVARPDLQLRIIDTIARGIFEIRMTECHLREDELVSLSPEDIKENSEIIFNDSLLLVNAEYLLSDNYIPEIVEYKNTGVLMNTCITDAYARLSHDISQYVGDRLFVRSSYRTKEEQAALHQSEGELALMPGASEHQTGLALDVYVSRYAGYGFIKSKAGLYVNLYAHKYGFIIRYPRGKSNITGMVFEPWHIRYVGLPHSEIMYTNEWCLEEYITRLEIGKFYAVNEYIISRQKGENLLIPSSLTDLVISPDNSGAYIITGKKVR
ncbi:MAG: M15 family metallopeptidase [Clostridiales bacterium]|nr:M15 family metallopeptidase [Clostridiales bacterium]